jgi:hypothetical protein
MPALTVDHVDAMYTDEVSKQPIEKAKTHTFIGRAKELIDKFDTVNQKMFDLSTGCVEEATTPRASSTPVMSPRGCDHESFKTMLEEANRIHESTTQTNAHMAHTNLKMLEMFDQVKLLLEDGVTKRTWKIKRGFYVSTALLVLTWTLFIYVWYNDCGHIHFEKLGAQLWKHGTQMMQHALGWPYDQDIGLPPITLDPTDWHTLYTTGSSVEDVPSYYESMLHSLMMITPFGLYYGAHGHRP